jgi:hypothetical protein
VVKAVPFRDQRRVEFGEGLSSFQVLKVVSLLITVCINGGVEAVEEYKIVVINVTSCRRGEKVDGGWGGRLFIWSALVLAQDRKRGR